MQPPPRSRTTAKQRADRREVGRELARGSCKRGRGG